MNEMRNIQMEMAVVNCKVQVWHLHKEVRKTTEGP